MDTHVWYLDGNRLLRVSGAEGDGSAVDGCGGDDDGSAVDEASTIPSDEGRVSSGQVVSNPVCALSESLTPVASRGSSSFALPAVSDSLTPAFDWMPPDSSFEHDSSEVTPVLHHSLLNPCVSFLPR